MPAIAQALREAHGGRGGRFSEVVIFQSGPTIMTVGPIMLKSKPVGVVLVMTPLADALGRLSQQVGADLTAYTPTGVPIATTVPFRPANVPHDEARALIGGGAITMRYAHSGQREALGRLILDHQADAVLGVTLADNSSDTGRAVTLYAGLGLVGAVLIFGTFWVRISNRWTG
jgi:hypothetical protein